MRNALENTGEDSVDLNVFQARLLKRIDAVRDAPQSNDSRLGFMIGDMYCLLDLRDAIEIMPVMDMTVVPLTHDWYLGLTNIRGNLTGIIDASRFMGGACQVIDEMSRIIVMSPPGSGGVLVSRILGLRYLSEMQLQLQVVHDNTRLNVRKMYRDQNHINWMELNIEALLETPNFLRVGL